MSYPRIEAMRVGMHALAQSFGNLLVESFHYLALFAIGGITAWASVVAFLGMLEKGHVTVDDILLLFIYLELGAMVGIYFKTNHMPVRFLIYVAYHRADPPADLRRVAPPSPGHGRGLRLRRHSAAGGGHPGRAFRLVALPFGAALRARWAGW